MKGHEDATETIVLNLRIASVRVATAEADLRGLVLDAACGVTGHDRDELLQIEEDLRAIADRVLAAERRWPNGVRPASDSRTAGADMAAACEAAYDALRWSPEAKPVLDALAAALAKAGCKKSRAGATRRWETPGV